MQVKKGTTKVEHKNDRIPQTPKNSEHRHIGKLNRRKTKIIFKHKIQNS